MTLPLVTIVVPAFHEEGIGSALRRIVEAIHIAHEVLVVVDTPDDRTIAAFAAEQSTLLSCRMLIQDYGVGPANAIRFGIDAARSRVVVVTMADGSDEVDLIPEHVGLVCDGNAIAVASRYVRGGQQIGGPLMKRTMSRLAGLLLQVFARVGTFDATNSFKAYDTEFLRTVGIHSRAGFEIGIELVAKARRLRLPVAEIPTIWLDRDLGVSNFRLGTWLPEYLRWFFFAFGAKLTPQEVTRRATASQRSHTP